VTTDRRRSDTRQRIQQVALELFAEQGYEKTSLRRIAEHLGVTQAALYYHFKTKQDILGGIIDDLGAQVDQLAQWAQTQPPTAHTRQEVLRRLAELLAGQWRTLMRFAQENQPTLRDLPVGERINDWMGALLALLIDPGAGLAEQFRARLAVAALLMGNTAIPGIDATDEQRAATALEVASELVADRHQCQ
jgi:AcrR family transcriptional regulator